MTKVAGQLSAWGGGGDSRREESTRPRAGSGRARWGSSGVRATPGIHGGPGEGRAGPGWAPATCASSHKWHHLPEPVSFPGRRQRPPKAGQVTGQALPLRPALGEALCTESALIAQIPSLGIKITQHPEINTPGAFRVPGGRVQSGRVSEPPYVHTPSRGGTKVPTVVCSARRLSHL